MAPCFVFELELYCVFDGGEKKKEERSLAWGEGFSDSVISVECPV